MSSYKIYHIKVWLHLVIFILIMSLSRHGSFVLSEDFIFHIEENATVSTTVGQVLSSEFQPEFKAINLPPVFAFAPQTGTLSTASSLDRESEPHYSFIVLSMSTGLHKSVKIIIDDVNDNTPVFSQASVSRNVSENYPIGSKLELGSVSDPDESPNSISRIVVTQGDPEKIFRVEYFKSGAVFLIRLILDKQLDYEKQKSYQLLITAFDGGTSVRSADLNVLISVTNVNDNSPVFDTSRYIAKVSENKPVGSVIMTVVASDADLGAMGRVNYYIDHTKSDRDNFFSVDDQVGSIVLEKHLDYESSHQHEFTVIARDGMTASANTGTVRVVIEITNENDNPPQSKIVWLTELAQQVPENAGVGLSVARIEASDADTPETTVVYLNLSTNCCFRINQASPRIGFLVVDKALTSSTERSFSLTITLRDSPVTSDNRTLETTLRVSFTIRDVNDNAPIFDPSLYKPSLLANSPIGTKVVALHATDKDSSVNGQIRFTLLPNHPWFNIDSTTGIVTTAHAVTCGQVILVAQATDLGNPPLSSNATIHVAITGSNQHVPTFPESYRLLSIPENTVVDSCFSQITATDEDCGSAVSYSLVQPGSAPFRVQSITGWLCLTRTVDYEVEPRRHQLQLKATDQDGLFSTMLLDITITDFNDNRPIFLMTSIKVTTIPVAKQQPIARVVALDTDSGQFGQVEYYINRELSNTDAFVVNTTTGHVITTSSINEIAAGRTLTVVIGARDGPGLTALTEATLTIQIVAAVDQPVFTSQLFHFQLSESSRTATNLGQLTLSNAKPGTTLSIIQGGNSGVYLVLNAGSGSLSSTGEALTRAQTPFITAVVEAISADLSSRIYAQILVEVTPGDLGSNYPPRFAFSSFSVDVSESLKVSALIFQVYATGAGIRYTLTSNPNIHFNLNTTNGNLYLKTELDREASATHTVVVKAENSAGQATAEIIIRVLDANDNAPSCQRSHYETTLQTSVTVGTTVVTPVCSDKDFGANGQLSFMFQADVSGWAHLFSVDPDTGTVSVSQSLLFIPTPQILQLSVRVSDRGSPALANHIQISIQITPSNTLSPEFLDVNRTFWLVENSLPGSMIGKMTAYDRDIVSSPSTLVYSKETATSLVRLGTNDGWLRVGTGQSIDRETVGIQSLRLFVTDDVINGRSSAPADVTLVLLDLNDEAPVFLEKSYSSTLPDNLPIGTEVMQVTAKDNDLGANGSVSYRLLSPVHEEDLFLIHPQLGVISTKSVIMGDRNFSLRVIARDGGKPPLESEVHALVQVRSSLWNNGLQQNSRVTFQLVENLPAGYRVGRISLGPTTSYRTRRLVFQLSTTATDVINSFYIDYTTGDLSTTVSIDREVSPEFLFNVLVTDELAIVPPRSATVQVRVIIDDVNDNTPEFIQKPKDGGALDVYVAENSPPGTGIIQLTCQDPDDGVNGSVELTLRGLHAAKFHLDRYSGLLTTTQSLDREAEERIYLEVIATDSSTQPYLRLSSLLHITVNLIDRNDETPTLLLPQRSTTAISIGQPINTTVCRLLARDPDFGHNSQLRFGLSAPSFLGFSLDPVSGALRTTSDLRRVASAMTVKKEGLLLTSLSLNISVSDAGLPRRMSWQRLDVNILEDVHTGAPWFTKSIYSALLNTNSLPGHKVATVMAEVNSTRSHPALRYFIPQGMYSDLLVIDSTTGEITLKRLLKETDTRGRDKLYVVLGVELSSTSSLKTQMETTLLELHLVLPNLNQPKFQIDQYSLSIPEETSISSLLTVAADDPDKGKNGRLYYKIISGNTANKFNLNQLTGELLCSPLSYSQQKNYTLVIRAVDNDGAPSGLSGSSTIRITVLGGNTHAPAFSNSRYGARVSEGAAPGSLVTSVSADDPDDGENGRVFYAFQSPEIHFNIDPNTGNITTVGHLDRETQSTYSIRVMAYDSSFLEPKSSAVSVDVTVTDANDNVPQLSSNPVTLSITSKGTPIGTHLTTISAIDQDIDLNAKLSYSLLDGPVVAGHGDVSHFYRLDETTGRLFTKLTLPYPEVGSEPLVHRLKVKVQDEGSPPLVSFGIIEVTIGGPVTHSIIFDPIEPHFHVEENSAPNTAIGSLQVNAIDSSITLTNPLRYSIIGGDQRNFVTIDTNTGALHVGEITLDRERQSTLYVWIMVLDHQNRTGYAKTKITVTDTDDNWPQFAQPSMITQIWEKSPRNTPVVQLNINDPDLDGKALVEFQIERGNADGAFAVSPTGLISAVLPLDHHTDQIRDLRVKAISIATPTYYTECSIKVQILNRNDQKPVLSRDLGTTPVSESVPAGTVIFKPQASDTDNTPLKFGLITGIATDKSNFPFAIAFDTGYISLVRRLDKEVTGQYQLNVTVSDGQFTEYGILKVTVLNENDNRPEFDQWVTSLAVDANRAANSLLGQVKAHDADLGDELTYKLLTQSSLYTVRTNGEVYTLATILASTPTVVLTVEVKDNPSRTGLQSLTNLATVRIFVTPTGQQTIAFSRQIYKLVVSEDAPIGHLLQTLTCVRPNGLSTTGQGVEYVLTASQTVETADGKFQVYRDSGALLLSSSLDRETISNYEFMAFCIDNGRPRITASTTVQITVSDTNDNIPKFVNAPYKVSINESHVTTDSASGYLPVNLLRIQATDNDLDVNAQLAFTLVHVRQTLTYYQTNSMTQNSDSILSLAFKVDLTTGQVNVIRTLPGSGVYELLIKVSDCGGGSLCSNPPFSSYTTLTLTVQPNLSPGGPLFPTALLVVSINENQPRGTKIFFPKAFDVNQPISYSLVSGSDDNFFEINSRYELVTKRRLDFESTPVLNVTLRATDSTGLSTQALVRIMVVDVDEFSPVFPPGNYNVVIGGGVPKQGQILARVQAQDEDSGPSGLIFYSLTEPFDRHLGINSTTGEIYLAQGFISLNETSSGSVGSRKKRSVQVEEPFSNKTELKTYDLVVKASSGTLAKSQTLEITMTVPVTTIKGILTTVAPGGGLAGTPLVLVICFSVLFAMAVVVVIVVIVRKRCPLLVQSGKKRKPPVHHNGFDSASHQSRNSYGSNFDPVSRPPLPPRTYPRTTSLSGRMPDLFENGVTQYPRGSFNLSNGDGNPGPPWSSSGRGSAATEEEVEAELRMINPSPAPLVLGLQPPGGVGATPQYLHHPHPHLQGSSLSNSTSHTSLLTGSHPGRSRNNMADSGIGGMTGGTLNPGGKEPDELGSELSGSLIHARNHVEYLAKLGIMNGSVSPSGVAAGHTPFPRCHGNNSNNSNHAFTSYPEALSSYNVHRSSPPVYQGLIGDHRRLPELVPLQDMRQQHIIRPQTPEDFLSAGLTNTYLQQEPGYNLHKGWSPAFEPLTHVFREIARFKDDNSPPVHPQQQQPHKPEIVDQQAVPPLSIIHHQPQHSHGLRTNGSLTRVQQQANGSYPHHPRRTNHHGEQLSPYPTVIQLTNQGTDNNNEVEIVL